jgi:uncharacterized membrane protein YeaQ/YmgE (transglycosylase-associated protein family)
MGILSWIIVGLIAGWLADTVMKTRGQGCIFSMILGIVGALVGGFLASTLFGVSDPLTGFDFRTLIIAFLGSIVTIWIVRAVIGRRPA